jgi:hypothetical protein
MGDRYIKLGKTHSLTTERVYDHKQDEEWGYIKYVRLYNQEYNQYIKNHPNPIDNEINDIKVSAMRNSHKFEPNTTIDYDQHQRWYQIPYSEAGIYYDENKNYIFNPKLPIICSKENINLFLARYLINLHVLIKDDAGHEAVIHPWSVISSLLETNPQINLLSCTREFYDQINHIYNLQISLELGVGERDATANPSLEILVKRMITAGLLTKNQVYTIESKFSKAKSKFAYEDVGKFKKTFISSKSNQKNYVLKMIGAPIDNFVEYETLGETYRQLIIQGAPGTGKSHYISEYLKNTKPYFETVSTRMVCHPESTNADFIGVYKPETIIQNGQKQVIYAFQPGVFTSMLAEALKDPTKIYIIILEEINRANSAAMFADVFQLLDRDKDGYSTYRTFIGKDVSQYLLEQLTSNHPEYDLIRNSGVVLPPNLWIWATMNTADQGVFPMDTAFKRRWMFKYIGLNDGKSWESEDWNPYIPNQNEPIKWQDLREKINEKLEAIEVEVDRQLGAYFLTKEELASTDLLEIIIIKVIGYLRDDVVRYQPDQLFNTKNSLFKLRDQIISSNNILGIFK